MLESKNARTHRAESCLLCGINYSQLKRLYCSLLPQFMAATTSACRPQRCDIGNATNYEGHAQRRILLKNINSKSEKQSEINANIKRKKRYIFKKKRKKIKSKNYSYSRNTHTDSVCYSVKHSFAIYMAR